MNSRILFAAGLLALVQGCASSVEPTGHAPEQAATETSAPLAPAPTPAIAYDAGSPDAAPIMAPAPSFDGGDSGSSTAVLVDAGPPGTDYTAWIDPGFDALTVQVILDGFSDWSAQAAPLQISATVGACPVGPHVLCFVLGTDAEEASLLSQLGAPAGAVLDGMTWRDAPSDSATTKLFPADWSRYGSDTGGWAVRHETGHALGLSHTGNGTVMCATWNCASSAVMAADVSQFWSLRPQL